MLKATIISLILTGCQPDMSRQERQEEWDKELLAKRKELIGSLHYTKDPRTNLCFASYNVGFVSAVMTQVPCTLEVEKVLDK